MSTTKMKRLILVKQPEELEMKCCWGTVKDVTITFPAGCHNVCHAHIDDELHQMFPTNPEGDYALNDVTLPIDDEYGLLADKVKIYLRGYNTGIFNHEISVTFKVIPPSVFTPIETILLRILKILERVTGIK